MAHEIDQTTGKASVFVTGEPAWHKLGVVIRYVLAPKPPQIVGDANEELKILEANAPPALLKCFLFSN